MAWDLVKNGAALGTNDSFMCHGELLRQFAFADMPRAAHAVLERMVRRGMHPSYDAYSLVLAAHARMWNKAAVLRLAGRAGPRGTGTTPQLRWYGRMVAGFLVAGRLDEARGIIDEFRTANEPNSWALPGADPRYSGALGTISPLRALHDMPPGANADPRASAEAASASFLGTVTGVPAAPEAGSAPDPDGKSGFDDVFSSLEVRRMAARTSTARQSRIPPALPEGTPIDAASLETDARRVRALGTVQSARLSLCSEAIGDLLNTVTLELRPRKQHFAGPHQSLAARDVVPITELAELVADVPQAPMLSLHERQHEERVAVSALLADTLSNDPARPLPHEIEVLALAQHISAADDGPLAAGALANPVFLSVLWRAAGLGPAFPGCEPSLIAHIQQPDTSAVLRDALVARQHNAQRLLETLLGCLAKACGDTWRGALPPALWTQARVSATAVYDALDTAGVSVGASTQLSVMTMAAEDHARRGGAGLALGLRAALHVEAHGVDTARPAELAELLKRVAVQGASEEGLRPSFVPTLASLRRWLQMGGGRPSLAVHAVDGTTCVWLPAAVDAVLAEEQQAEPVEEPGGVASRTVSGVASGMESVRRLDAAAEEGRQCREQALQQWLAWRRQFRDGAPAGPGSARGDEVAAVAAMRGLWSAAEDEHGASTSGLALARRLCHTVAHGEHAAAVERVVMEAAPTGRARLAAEAAELDEQEQRARYESGGAGASLAPAGGGSPYGLHRRRPVTPVAPFMRPLESQDDGARGPLAQPRAKAGSKGPAAPAEDDDQVAAQLLRRLEAALPSAQSGSPADPGALAGAASAVLRVSMLWTSWEGGRRLGPALGTSLAGVADADALVLWAQLHAHERSAANEAPSDSERYRPGRDQHHRSQPLPSPLALACAPFGSMWRRCCSDEQSPIQSVFEAVSGQEESESFAVETPPSASALGLAWTLTGGRSLAVISVASPELPVGAMAALAALPMHPAQSLQLPADSPIAEALATGSGGPLSLAPLSASLENSVGPLRAVAAILAERRYGAFVAASLADPMVSHFATAIRRMGSDGSVDLSGVGLLAAGDLRHAVRRQAAWKGSGMDSGLLALREAEWAHSPVDRRTSSSAANDASPHPPQRTTRHWIVTHLQGHIPAAGGRGNQRREGSRLSPGAAPSRSGTARAPQGRGGSTGRHLAPPGSARADRLADLSEPAGSRPREPTPAEDAANARR